MDENMTNHDLSNVSMLDLFRMEVEAQATILNDNLLVLETNPKAANELEALMRASHSIKGAARIVSLDLAVQIAHLMEDCFVAAQTGAIAIDAADKIDVLLQGVDLLLRISQTPPHEIEAWTTTHQIEFDNLVTAISAILTTEKPAIKTEYFALEERVNEPDQPENLSAPTPDHLPEQEPTLLEQSPDRDLSMLGLFRTELVAQITLIHNCFVQLKNHQNVEEIKIESLIAAVNLIKGAAMIVKLTGVINISRKLQERFLTIQEKNISLSLAEIDDLIPAIDLLLNLAEVPENDLDNWLFEHHNEIENIVALIRNKPENNQINIAGEITPHPPSLIINSAPHEQQLSNLNQTLQSTAKSLVEPGSTITKSAISSTHKQPDKNLVNHQESSHRVVRVSAENLNRLMGLAGESLLEANWLQPFADSLFKLRKQQRELYNLIEKLQESLSGLPLSSRTENYLKATRKKASECGYILTDRLNELELFSRRSANLSDRLYREVIASHMRPFADGVQGFPRMMRDLARQLGKQVKFEIIGKSTQVDRDILEKLEAPLTHILRNAIDHGIESPHDRVLAEKPPEGTVRLEAFHRAGMLSITVTDDGKGVELERLRQKIISKGMLTIEMANRLTEPELMEFLFLPGFSTASKVTDVSGRGVGLDIVQNMIQEVGGQLRAISKPGQGMIFHLQLPLTLSVIRTLLVEIAGEPYAFPLTRIVRIVMVKRTEIQMVENRQYFTLDQQNIGLVAAHQALRLTETSFPGEVLPTVVVSDRGSKYGLVVDRLLGERDLVVRPLDSRLGKLPNFSATALMENGSPLLIIDVDDLVRSIYKLLHEEELTKVSQTLPISGNRKSVLVVDDSMTVREVERKLLENWGYQVEIAVDGMDAWNAVRSNNYDLVITDVDMPRMNGIELVRRIKNSDHLKDLPVMIVSYKDREEDRIRGLDMGADYYLTKSSFQDDSFLNAVIALIGES